MALQDKYQSVLDLGSQYGNLSASEDNGRLQISGTVHSEYQKNQIWDRIKEIGGDAPSDLAADIRVEQNAYYDKYTVQRGDSLSKIAKHYYGDMMKYPQIFEANRGTLSNPDQIEVGQELIIPFE